MHCYFWHTKGKCKYGNNCVMKHVEISEAVKAKLRHPADILADEKAKTTAAPAVEREQSRPPDQRGKSRGRGRGTGKGKEESKGKGRDRSRTPGGTPIDKTGGKRQPAAKPKAKPRPPSPVPGRSESLGSQTGKINKEITKELRIPNFCKDFRAGTCDRPIVSSNPTCCKIGAHVTEEKYKQMREKQKVDVKNAKERRNRSQTPAPRK